MKKIFTLTTLVASMLGLSFSSNAQTTDLIISEYAEGSSNNKYVELYNGTGATIDLSDYEMWRISNGGSWPESTVSLSGMLADGEVIVIANSQADTAILNLPNATTAFNSATYFNGDDAVGLAKDDGTGTFNLIDAVGTHGPDPGQGWDVAGTTNGTANYTLIRKDTVCSPDTTWSVTAGTNTANSQWIVMPQNDWNDAGSHTSSCSGTAPATGITELFFSRYVEWNHNATSPSTFNHALEIFNGTSGTIDLTDYMVRRSKNGGGWDATYDLDLSGSIAAGGTFVITRNPANDNVTIVGDTVWDDLNISGDDAVGIFKNDGTGTYILIDVVGDPDNDPGSGWDVAGVAVATQNNTLLRKLSVCGPDTNWSASAGTNPSNSQWVVLGENNITGLGTYVTACGQNEPVLGFSTSSTNVQEMDTTFMIDIELSNSNALPVTYVVDYDTVNSSAENGVDVDFTPVTVMLPAMTDSVVSVSFTVNEDMDDEGMTPEEAILHVHTAVNADLVGPVHTVTIMDDDFAIPTYDIATVRTVDADYVVDSLGVYCKLEGIVYGTDLFGGGYSFTLNDGTAGINVLSFSNIGSFEVNQGDELRVIGEIGQYNGLAQIQIDSVVVLSTGNCIEFPAVVFELDEYTESEPIYMMGVHLADPSQWPSAGSNANLDVVTIEGDTITMRIDKDTHIADSITSAPTGIFNLSGIGGQFDNSSPYDEGYQIFPMFPSDFDTVPAAVTGLYINEVMVDNQSVEMDPEGDYDSWVEIYNSNGTDVDMTGMFVYSEGADMPYRFPRCEAAVVVPANGWAMLWADDENVDGAAHLPFMLDAADIMYIVSKDGMMVDSLGWDSSVTDVSFGHRQDGNMDYVSFEQATPNASNNGGIVLSVINAVSDNALNVYPNPVSTGVVNFSKVVDVKVYSLTGTLVANRTNVKSINVSNFDKGVYIIETNEGEIVKMIVE